MGLKARPQPDLRHGLHPAARPRDDPRDPPDGPRRDLLRDGALPDAHDGHDLPPRLGERDRAGHPPAPAPRALDAEGSDPQPPHRDLLRRRVGVRLQLLVRAGGLHPDVLRDHRRALDGVRPDHHARPLLETRHDRRRVRRPGPRRRNGRGGHLRAEALGAAALPVDRGARLGARPRPPPARSLVAVRAVGPLGAHARQVPDQLRRGRRPHAALHAAALRRRLARDLPAALQHGPAPAPRRLRRRTRAGARGGARPAAAARPRHRRQLHARRQGARLVGLPLVVRVELLRVLPRQRRLARRFPAAAVVVGALLLRDEHRRSVRRRRRVHRLVRRLLDARPAAPLPRPRRAREGRRRPERARRRPRRGPRIPRRRRRSRARRIRRPAPSPT